MTLLLYLYGNGCYHSLSQFNLVDCLNAIENRASVLTVPDYKGFGGV